MYKNAIFQHILNNDKHMRTWFLKTELKYQLNNPMKKNQYSYIL